LHNTPCKLTAARRGADSTAGSITIYLSRESGVKGVSGGIPFLLSAEINNIMVR
jgi:hypothetical protein